MLTFKSNANSEGFATPKLILHRFTDSDSRIHEFLHRFTDSGKDSQILVQIHGFRYRFADFCRFMDS